jgi:hypothetical protein
LSPLDHCFSNSSVRFVQHATAAQVVQQRRDALGQRVRSDPEARRPLLHELEVGAEAPVADLQAPPRLEAEALLHAGRDLAEDLDAQEVEPLFAVLGAALVEGHDLPDLGEQRAGQVAVLVEDAVEGVDHVADRGAAVGDLLGHERAQPEAAGVILHPSGLERGVLAVVGEDEQTWSFGQVQHRLRQHVHVRDADSADRARRFAVTAAARALSGRLTGHARVQQPRILLLGAHDLDRDQRVLRVADHAGSRCGPRAGSRSGAHEHRMESTVLEVVAGRREHVAVLVDLLGVLVLVGADDHAVDHQHARAVDGLGQVLPDAGHADPVAARGTGLHAREQLEVLHPRLVVVLAAGGAGHHREAPEVVAQLGRGVLSGEPQAGGAARLRQGDDGAADPAHERMHDRPQQRVVVAAAGGCAEREPASSSGSGTSRPTASERTTGSSARARGRASASASW